MTDTIEVINENQISVEETTTKRTVFSKQELLNEKAALQSNIVAWQKTVTDSQTRIAKIDELLAKFDEQSE